MSNEFDLPPEPSTPSTPTLDTSDRGLAEQARQSLASIMASMNEEVTEDVRRRRLLDIEKLKEQIRYFEGRAGRGNRQIFYPMGRNP